ncbi:PRC-barrel domain-containing protein [Clostridium sp.]|uniref:PRC-barrel domain-containing protein n=1 Tax=Clostridium sp. TaxID=1506 RepID=UPI003F68016A
MIRTKFFYMKRVYTKEGKYIGIIEDLALDFFKGEIIGFKVSLVSLISKKNFLDIKDIISIDEYIIIEKMTKKIGLYFKEMRRLEILNLEGDMIGVFEDLIIDENTNKICGIIISTGIIEKIMKGKRVLFLDDCILGDKSIIYIGCEKLEFKIMIKGMEGRFYEKNKIK